ncbi:hypothetical protein TA3x_004953 [Tundrisphaera sp. TA3]|uniref:hypothetical protein n=1 Tax=Tundrisphaera sp. TA3 TaxID=3435775 RepID=UPI003EB9BCF7
MTTPLLPQAFWFRTAFPCRRVEGIPRDKGRLLDLPDACALPDLAAWEGRESWGSARVGWNEAGLGIAFEVGGKVGQISPEWERPSGADGVQVYVDTRDTRTVHRATRFCHRFAATVRPASGKALAVEVASKPIARAVADAPMARPQTIAARAERTVSGYRLELFFPAEVLHGFDPETNRRLGFFYILNDPDRGEQGLGVGREFPVGEDPSLWSVLQLQDA